VALEPIYRRFIDRFFASPRRFYSLNSDVLTRQQAVWRIEAHPLIEVSASAQLTTVKTTLDRPATGTFASSLFEINVNEQANDLIAASTVPSKLLRNIKGWSTFQGY